MNDQASNLTEFRTERDSMGEIQVPADKYWGAQTERSRRNFPAGAGHETMPEEILRAFAILKKAAAEANHSFVSARTVPIDNFFYLGWRPLQR